MDSVKLWMQQNLKGDPVIWIIVFMFSLLSVAAVYSATGTLAYKRDVEVEQYLINHSLLMFLSLGAMWVAHRVDYRYYSRLSRFALILSVPLLLYAFFFGTNLNEASRWIEIPLINKTFQPSDLAKLALIANLAAMLSKRQQNITDKELLTPVLFWIGLICGLIALSNFSTAGLLFATCLLLMFIGRVPVKYLFLLILIGAIGGGLAFAFGQRGGTLLSRIESYTSPGEISYQTEQSYIAIATGGIAGKGPGNSDSRNLLPHPYSDFIYAIIIEEYGLFGGILVIFLYLALLYRGMKAVSQSERAFGGLLSAGLAFALVLQAFVNMGVAVGILPVTGQPLPMISMGGTSLLFNGLALGIILSVSRGDVEDIATAPKDVGNYAKTA
ncbi:FtsW/RodA/SpoVE family cell cycle protein [Cesiribacter sp. SM1]|uniref:FtsW/RodA/SpoVE family cell cycle protein n=1 Tax=Cesiribacter sp. SM1 TaxID=2861196 RepID=UPI00351D1514